MHTFKIKFYLRPESERKDKMRTIQVRIYLDHERDYLTSTRFAIPASAWDAKQEKVTMNTPKGRFMNCRISNLRKAITDIYHLHEADATLSVETFKQSYLSYCREKADQDTVCIFFERYIKETGEAIGQDALCRLEKVSTLFRQFVEYTYNVKDIDFTDIDRGMLKDFVSYLRINEDYGNDRTLRNKVYVLKTLLCAAQELGMMKANPFDGYTLPASKHVKVESLTIDEVKLLKKAEFETNRLDKVRDCFLFSCYTGLSYQELKSLTKEHLTRLNGSEWILLEGPGGAIPRYIPLLPYPASIIRKYETDDEQTPLLPLISQQKTNLYLKEIAGLCGIEKSLTFQLAVNTFIKTALSSGTTIDSVSNMLGKPVSKVAPFATFSPERIEEEMALLNIRLGRDRLEGNASNG